MDVLLVILVSTVQMVRICSLLFISTRSYYQQLLYNNNNWPLLSLKNADCQNEAKFKIFLVKMSFICMTAIKNHFLINGVALTLALRQKLVETRKCPFLALKEPITVADPESYVSFVNSRTKRN